MNYYFLFIVNIIIPVAAGLIYLLFFLYFSLIKPSSIKSYKCFVIYLFSFSLFLLGRPFQLLLGDYPLPLLVNNLRMLLLCGLTIPMLFYTTDLLRVNKVKYKSRATLIFLASISLGLIYTISNCLGTKSTYLVFLFGDLIAYDNYTPSMFPPYYTREVTIIIQVIAGLLIFFASFLNLLSFRKRDLKFLNILKNKFFLINFGISIFAVSFIAGSFLRIWWIYYIFSLISILFLILGLLIDMREVHIKLEKFIPFIREELFQNEFLLDPSSMNITRVLNIIGKTNKLDTFLIIKINYDEMDEIKKVNIFEKISDRIKNFIDMKTEEENYIIIPLAINKIGIALSVLKGLKKSNINFFDFIEKLKDNLLKKYGYNFSIGIGRSYEDIQNLKMSYNEAISALEYSEKIGENSIIHVDNVIKSQPREIKYPFKEKNELLLSVKLGDIKAAKSAVKNFLNSFNDFSGGKMEIIKIRMYELAGSLIDSAINGGGDEGKLNNFDIEYFKEINTLQNFSETESWLTKVTEEVVRTVSNEHNDRSKMLIKKAMNFIEDNYNKSLTVKDVAHEIFVSPSYFLNLFKQRSGYTFIDFLTKVRVQKAKELLLHSDMSITDIAFEVGYNDSNYFSTVFKNNEGSTPVEYRKINIRN